MHSIKWIGIVIFIISSLFSSTYAQKDDSIYQGNRILNLKWSDDGQFLTFKDEADEFGLITESDSWKLYNVETQETSVTKLYPFLVTLNTDQESVLGLNQDTSIQLTPERLYLFSPTSNYVIYKLPGRLVNQRHTFSTFAIGNLVKGTYYDLKISTIGLGDSGPDTFNVIWSDDESSAIAKIINDYGENQFWYIYNYVDSLEEAEYIWLNGLFSDARLMNVSDISSDGTQILVQIRQENETTLQAFLMNPESNTLTLLNLGTVVGMAFTDEDELVFVNEEGLGLYNLKTEEVDIIDTSINATWADYALFSPDLKHIAVVDAMEDAPAYNDLYVYEVQLPD